MAYSFFKAYRQKTGCIHKEIFGISLDSVVHVRGTVGILNLKVSLLQANDR